MRRMLCSAILAATMTMVLLPALAETPVNLQSAPFAKWSRGPGADPSYFPITVWMQDPRDAAAYKAAGINGYKNLWNGPTAEQLDQLRKAGMPVICPQNDYALAHLDDPIIVGWMQDDEPDNAHKINTWANADQLKAEWRALPASLTDRPLKAWGQYGPPRSPKHVKAEYKRMRKNDPTRPIFLHLGQSVSWDAYKGRGVRTGHNEDYPEYVKGADVTNFDIYPSVHRSPDVRGKLEWVPRGVDNLRTWGKDERIVTVAIECTRIGDATTKPKPKHVKSEIWMAITHGARGICYFVHEFVPKFNHNGLLDDKQMLAAVTKINHEIHALAPVINSPSADGLVTTTSANPKVPMSVMTKQYEGDTYIFAVAMRPVKTLTTFAVKDLPAGTQVKVIGENRTIKAGAGQFRDRFVDYAVHLYRISGK